MHSHDFEFLHQHQFRFVNLHLFRFLIKRAINYFHFFLNHANFQYLHLNRLL